MFYVSHPTPSEMAIVICDLSFWVRIRILSEVYFSCSSILKYFFFGTFYCSLCWPNWYCNFWEIYFILAQIGINYYGCELISILFDIELCLQHEGIYWLHMLCIKWLLLASNFVVLSSFSLETPFCITLLLVSYSFSRRTPSCATPLLVSHSFSFWIHTHFDSFLFDMPLSSHHIVCIFGVTHWLS